MIVTKRSIISRAVHSMDLPVTQEQLDRHRAGGLVQDVFPDLTVQQREFLISGMSLEEQAAFFEGPPAEVD